MDFYGIRPAGEKEKKKEVAGDGSSFVSDIRCAIHRRLQRARRKLIWVTKKIRRLWGKREWVRACMVSGIESRRGCINRIKRDATGSI